MIYFFSYFFIYLQLLHLQFGILQEERELVLIAHDGIEPIDQQPPGQDHDPHSQPITSFIQTQYYPSWTKAPALQPSPPQPPPAAPSPTVFVPSAAPSQPAKASSATTTMPSSSDPISPFCRNPLDQDHRGEKPPSSASMTACPCFSACCWDCSMRWPCWRASSRRR